MEEFEKWQKKALKHEHSPSVYYGAEQGWKAALEWAVEKCEKLDDSFILDCWCFNIVQNKIEEELNGEAENGVS